jgi:hypothetical protein
MRSPFPINVKSNRRETLKLVISDENFFLTLHPCVGLKLSLLYSYANLNFRV